MLTLKASAKLNLYLHVLGRRAGGYHDIESLVAFTALADGLTIMPANELSLTVDGEFANEAGASETNLVLRAAEALRKHTGCTAGAALHLTKNIPVGAGLGGGSADAAACLRGLNRLWQLGLSQQDLRAIALPLGADVPMCLDSVPAIARGIGEDLTPLLGDMPPLYAVLVHPRTPLLTKDVYAAYKPGAPATAWQHTAAHGAAAFLATLATTRNHLQPAAVAVDSNVAEVLLTLETLQPASPFVRMSGSGACCFALYASASEAARAAAELARHYPHWWVKQTELLPAH